MSVSSKRRLPAKGFEMGIPLSVSEPFGRLFPPVRS